MDREDFAAKAAFDELKNGDLAMTRWEDLHEGQRLVWRRVARKVQEATPAPFFVQMDIKVPEQEVFGVDRKWRLSFGISDVEIEQAGKDFVEMMKKLRDQ